MSISDPRFVGLNTGDKVLVDMEIDGGWRFTRRVTVEQTVTRTTKTQFTTNRGTRFKMDTGREIGGREYGGASAFPVGFMVGQGWGKEPVPMQVTPPAEIHEWHRRCAVAASFDTLVSKLSRQSSRRLMLIQQDPELVAQLSDVLPILQTVLDKTGN